MCHIYFTGYHRQSGFLAHENDANCNHQIEPNEPDAPLEFTDYLENVFIQTGTHVIALYKVTDQIRQPSAVKLVRRKFNILHRSRRVFIGY